MKKLTQFSIKTKNGIVVNGEYEGNKNSNKVVIFSHGFGVTRNSHGMFVEIGNLLKEKFLVVRFDYSIVNKEENWTKVYPYSIQVEMLKAVYSFVYSNFHPKEITIIASSMGCLITGLAMLPKIKKILLLVGPINSPYQNVIDYFSKRPETMINEKSTSIIKRSDGSITYVESDFWKEMKDINPINLYKKLIKNSEIIFIRATADQIIKDTNYDEIENINGLKYIEIDGDHDFGGDARGKLLNIISVTLV
ncbi:hypothetical protein KBD45_04875 [Candidatus Dojkabacteria bacterium]|nr:hypothetical protein [Candidatus Dojkabacteria bacterium]